MKRYPAFEPPEYVAWKADPALVDAFRDTVNRVPERQEVVARLSRDELLTLLDGPEATTPATRQPATDRLLNVAEACQRLGVKDRWLYRHAAALPFAKRLSAHALRFSERGLEKYIAARR